MPLQRRSLCISAVSLRIERNPGGDVSVALQHRIAKAIDNPKTAGPAFAALIKQQRDIAAEIHAIDLAAEAGSAKSGSQSAIATTPDKPWDESMI